MGIKGIDIPFSDVLDLVMKFYAAKILCQLVILFVISGMFGLYWLLCLFSGLF